ncbi:hypothetical protein NG796_15470 [Laspinema sp. A4]|uniref:hypothetical protein n=1 Tax=Laspinema sp. D2d TaxID=2953686 RepID=UPI0021BAEB01|nr:hypothetical protein [Laspinema sp. D2d]MCT7984697.1 hypothetical protein [Laspinema sp. D2d]
MMMIRKIRSRLGTSAPTHPDSPAQRWRKGGLLGLSLVALTVGLIPLNPAPASARNNDYNRCAAELLDRQLSPETVALACASALRPEELSECVVEINSRTDILAEDALTRCQQVRRPLELATCVVEISDGSTEGEAPLILDFCRRSLLPAEFSECVVGLQNQIDLVTSQAMSVCIDTRDRVGSPLPNFIPGREPPAPTRPSPNLPST